MYRSGSETERESNSSLRGSSSHRSSTSASYSRPTASALARAMARTTPSPPSRRRTPSAPSSPLRALTAANTTRNSSISGLDQDEDITTTSAGTVQTTSSTGSGSASGSNNSRRRKRVSLALTTPSRLAHIEAVGDEDEPYNSFSHANEFRERERGAIPRARTSLSTVSPSENRRQLLDRDRDKEVGSVTRSALAAVASSRRSMTNGSGSPYMSDVGGSGGKKRGALPAEFVKGRTGNPSSEQSPPPNAPHRSTSMTFTSSNSSSTSTVSYSSAAVSQSSASGSAVGNPSRAETSLGIVRRPSTIRHESRQKWASDDFTSQSASATSFAIDSKQSLTEGWRRIGMNDPPHTAEITPPRRAGKISSGEVVMGMAEYRERRQSVRGGSAESALLLTPGRRSLVAEGFRAAGIGRPQVAKRLSLDDPERPVEVGRPVFRRPSASGRLTSVVGGWESDGDGGRDPGTGRTRTGTVVRQIGEVGGMAPRAATSMAVYRSSDGENFHEMRDRAVRNSRSAHPFSPKQRDRTFSLTREREALDVIRSESSMSRYGALRSHALRDQSVERSSPFGTGGRNYSGSSSGNAPQTSSLSQRDQDHLSLMLESLNMFEGQLSRLGGGGSGLGELLKNTETIVIAAEKLNSMLRSGTSRAVEEQVRAEVDDHGKRGAEMAAIWGQVGGDFRDGLRVSDELVRGMTAFLLGITKIVKDLSIGGNGDLQHGRSVSLDEEGLSAGKKRWTSPDVFVGPSGPPSSAGSGSGRRSVESRRSWEQRECTREDYTKKLPIRADSAMGQARPSSSISRDRERLEGKFDIPPDTASRGPGSAGSSQARRLFTPREQREAATPSQVNGMRTIYSQEPLHDFEPSPSPAPRNQYQNQGEVNQTLPPLVIPRPLPALPSERYLLRDRSFPETPSGSTAAEVARDREQDRRKASVTSIQTIRGNASNPPSLTTPSNVTTAITPHTVSTGSLEKAEYPLPQRTLSHRTSRSEAVTFSRSSTASLNALNGLHRQDERRRKRSDEEFVAESGLGFPAKRFVSSSDNEWDTRRQTLATIGSKKSFDREIIGARSKSRPSTPRHTAERDSVPAPRAVDDRTVPTRRERRKTVTDVWPKES